MENLMNQQDQGNKELGGKNMEKFYLFKTL